ncbi:hypothetical protein NQD34_018368 [Periophthalmus magnuspinnatus]|nr:hypothetical protein NQD34_018368 [Periophthalmus magnuspinnatus]
MHGPSNQKKRPQSDTERQHMEVREDGEVSGAEQLEESRPETKQRELSNSSSSPESPATTVKAEPNKPNPWFKP